MTTVPDLRPEALTGLATWEQYLRDSAVPRDILDRFLNEPGWATFDAELGYALRNNATPFGLDGTTTIETFRADGARSGFLYAGRVSRVHCYGDSFTECSQVSDGETWQEYLAGHLGEPIANFGVGGYGVYQAYRRMCRLEARGSDAQVLVLYVWGDDPTRSLMRARWPVIYRFFTPVVRAFNLFHANFWAHVELDLDSGEFAERENRLPTPQALYAMCDPDWMVENLRDDLAVQLAAFAGAPQLGLPGSIRSLDRDRIGALADRLGMPFDWRDGDLRSQASRLLNRYGQRATVWVLTKARAFAESLGKTLLVALNATARLGNDPGDGVRGDQEILDHLRSSGCATFDMNDVHAREHGSTQLSFADYMKPYLVGGTGHYNPRGNHLFAYAIKDVVVSLLDPKPLPYRARAPGSPIDFRGYLPGYD